MILNKNIRHILILTLLSTFTIECVLAKCKQCNKGHACVGLNTFQMCTDGEPDTAITFDCGPDQICTTFSHICIDPSTAIGLTPDCGDTSQCGKCSDAGDGSYTCTSRTTYTMCFNDMLSNIRVSCPAGEYCSVNRAAQTSYSTPCVDECAIGTDKICDVEEAVDAPTEAPSDTTTTEEPTTTTTTEEPTTTTTTEEPTTTTTTEEPTTTTTTEEPTTTTTTEEPTTTTTTEEPTTTTTTEEPTTTTTTEEPTTTTTTEEPTTTTTTEEPTTTTTTEEPTTTTTTEEPTTTTTTEEPTTTTTTEEPTTTTTTEEPTTTTTTEEPTTTTTTEEPTTTTTTEEPTTTTTTEEPTTTLSPTDAVCSEQSVAGRYPLKNDNICKRYVNCFFKGGVLQGFILECSQNTYFNKESTVCDPKKPEHCI